MGLKSILTLNISETRHFFRAFFWHCQHIKAGTNWSTIIINSTNKPLTIIINQVKNLALFQILNFLVVNF